MKKTLFLLVSSIALMGCECECESGSGSGDSGKVEFNGTDISGLWVCVEKYGKSYYDNVEEIEEYDGNVYTFYEAKGEDDKVDSGFPIKEGYLIGCTMDDFECGEKAIYSIEGNDLFVGGYWWGTISLKGDKLSITSYDDDVFVYQKIKGFK